METRTENNSSNITIKKMTAKDYGLESDTCRFTLQKYNTGCILTMGYKTPVDDKKKLITKLQLWSELSEPIKTILDHCKIDCIRRHHGKFYSVYTFTFAKENYNDDVEAQLVYVCELLSGCRAPYNDLNDRINLFNLRFNFPTRALAVEKDSVARVKQVRKRKLEETHDSQDKNVKTVESKAHNDVDVEIPESKPQVVEQYLYQPVACSEEVKPPVDLSNYIKSTFPELNQSMLPFDVSGMRVENFDPDDLREFEASYTQVLDDEQAPYGSTNIFDQVAATKHEIDFLHEEESFLKKPRRSIDHLEANKGSTTEVEKLSSFDSFIAKYSLLNGHQKQARLQKQLDEKLNSVIAIAPKTEQKTDKSVDKSPSSFVYPKADALKQASLFKSSFTHSKNKFTICAADYGYTKPSVKGVCYFYQSLNTYEMEMIRVRHMCKQENIRNFIPKLNALSASSPDIMNTLKGVKIHSHHHRSSQTGTLQIIFDSSIELSLLGQRKKELIVLLQIASNYTIKRHGSNSQIVSVFLEHLSNNAINNPKSTSHPN